MKVKVKVKSSSNIQAQYYEQVIAEAYAENERLFQMNRDLERRIICMERDAAMAKKQSMDEVASYKMELDDRNERINQLELRIEWLKSEAKEADKARQEAEHVQAMAEMHIDELNALLAMHEMGHYKRETEEWKKTADELADKVNELNGLLNAERRKTHRLEADMIEANETLEKLEDTERMLEACEEQLGFAHERIAEQQKIIADASDTITSLQTQNELRPKFVNLWELLKEAGMLVDVDAGPHNNT